MTGRPKHRLVLCLDGTWNDRDDCTNVYHLANLVREGEVAGKVVQRVFYQAGVGTGPLDKLTGGGFGFGLEKNVREAYNRLIEEYHDDDEIYVFGFSRGAFTARSLIGLIACYGLLRRAAPLTVNQLWSAYCILGRQREQREGWWERLFGQRDPPARAIAELKWDTWLGGQPRGNSLNRTEELICLHSRRPKITFLGVFDTVGAVGWDALAIPGLRGKLALQHNMHLTTILQSVYHALAIDEHRSSFEHTPFAEYQDGDDATWQGKRARWNNRVQQRWFVGPHASVGGGYPDNELALEPLAWMLAGAEAAGLEFETPRPLPPARALRRPDSYALFARPLYQHLLRAKRSYRPIAPAPVVRAGRANGNAFRLERIGEAPHESVERFAHADVNYAPPNLLAFARANPQVLPSLARRTARRTPWPGTGKGAAAWVLLWIALAGFGVQGLARFFGHPVNAFVSVASALLLVLVDWGESRLGFGVALNGEEPWRMALADVLFWLRAVGVVFALAGLMTLGSLFWPSVPSTANDELAGRLLLLVIGGLTLRSGLEWAEAPLWRANLGSIVGFQLAPASRLAHWRARLELRCGDPREIGPGPATVRLVALLREALWRDSFGFVPLYTLVFALAAWVATQNLKETWAWLASPVAPGIELWHVFLAATAGLDLLENAIHFDHARRFEAGRPLSRSLVWLGVPCSVVKNNAFVLGVVLLVSVLVEASWTVAPHASGWRATLAVLGTCGLLSVASIWTASVVWPWIRFAVKRWAAKAGGRGQ